MTQAQALELLKMGHHAYITGPAGSGKTYLLQEYISYLRFQKVSVAITASTGLAATHMDGGQTVHSWSGLGIKKTITDAEIRDLLGRNYLHDNIKSARVLIIDEISMLQPEQLDSINRICQTFRKDDRPFGGLQFICSGDFFQLPPVVKNSYASPRFVTEAVVWSQMGLLICYLHEQHRQLDDKLTHILNAVRDSRVDESIVSTLYQRLNQEITSDVKPTKLRSHNADADAINNMELDKLTEKKHVYRMHGKGNPKLVERLMRDCLAPEILEVKKGAAVMFVKNDKHRRYVNGTLGTVTGYDDNDWPVVKTASGRTVIAQPEEWSIENNRIKLASIDQVPLRLAWAITIHKSQGMTLDAAEINLSKAFVEGMGYVALSRIRSLANLKLMGINDTALRVSPKATDLDAVLRQESEAAVNYLVQASLTDRQQLQERFIKSNRI